MFFSPLDPTEAPFARTLDCWIASMVMMHLENPKSPLEPDRADPNPFGNKE